MTDVHIDFETWAPVSVTEVGAHKYASLEGAKIVNMAWAIDRGRIETAYEIPKKPPFPLDATFHAHNAQFEMAIWKACLPWPMPKKWVCSAARAAYNGLPRSLENAGRVADCLFQKSPTGKRLLTKLQKQGELNFEDQLGLIEYNIDDVLAEMDLESSTMPMPASEEELWQMDCRINDRGILIDRELLEKAMAFVDWYKDTVEKKVLKLTGVKTSQRDKLLMWFHSQNYPLPDLTAPTLKYWIPKTEGDLQYILKSRVDLSSAGVKKFGAISAGLMDDDRLRGSLLFYGASTGRWSSLRVQVHNFARGDVEQQKMVIKLLMAEDWKALRRLDMPLAAISLALRGFILGPLTVADYNAIEARVLAWMADETWLLEAFENDQDPYVMMAMDIFGKNEKAISYAERFTGKTTILGAGYGMGGDTFDQRIGEQSIIPGEEVVAAYRKKNRRIVNLWYKVEDAVSKAVRQGGRWEAGKCVFQMKGKHLTITLPSGRDLIYRNAEVTEGYTPWGAKKDQLSFVNNFGAWESSWGGKLVENMDQAISRDIMAAGMLSCEKQKMYTLFTVHDEVVIKDKVPPRELEQALCDIPEWGKGIPLKAGGFTSNRYEKR